MIKVSNLSIKYKDDKPLFKDLCFICQAGRSLAIYGSNGSGKTSLLNALCGLIPEKIDAKLYGDIKIFNKNIKDYKRSEFIQILGYIMSNYEDNMIFNKVSDELAFPLENLCIKREEIEDRINNILALMDITDLKDKKVRELSSGQKALINIASVLIVKPTIILCDEIFKHTDEKYTAKIWSILNYLKDKGHIIIIVDQDMENISKCDNQLCLDVYRKGAE
jgi:energy-coupling factor transporter ATP-binding protein EcfA2